MTPRNFRPSPIRVLLALALAAPLGALAEPTEAQVQAMEKKIQALEARLDQLSRLLEAKSAPAAPTGAATPASPAWGDPVAAPAQISQAEYDKLKQRVARQDMKVSKLFTDAYDGPGAGLQITGYLDPTYVVNKNRRSASFQFLNAGDPYSYDNSENGDVFLHITKTLGEGLLAPKADVQLAMTRGYGSFATNSSGTVVPSIVHQATLAVPISDTTVVVAGRFGGFAGYEYYESALVNTVSHNLLYDFSAAGGMTGAGINITKGDWAWKTFLGNEEYYVSGSQVGQRPNRVPAFGARLDYTANTALYLGGSVYLGRDTLYGTDTGCDAGYGYQCVNGSGYGGKLAIDLDLSYLTADAQYNAQFDYGQIRGGAWNGGDARWWGLSGLAHRKWTTASLGRIGASVLLDYLNNSRNGGGSSSIYLGSADTPGTDPVNGLGIAPDCYAADQDADGNSNNGRNCKGANRFALTTAFMLYPSDQWTLKGEYRHDWANLAVFGTQAGSFRRSNDVFSLQMVYAF